MADASQSCSRIPEAERHRRFRLTLLIMVCWLIAVGVALYHFEFQPLRPFQPSASSDLPAYPPGLATVLPAAPTGRPTIVHILDPTCDCLRYTRSHLTALQKEPDFLEADHVVVSAPLPDQSALQPHELIGAAQHIRSAMLNVPLRTPAVAIFDAQHNLSYYGPYSLGPACGRAGDTIMPVLEALHEGRAAPDYDLGGRTCYCDPPQNLLTASISAGGARSE
ncbi:DUF6436 domain-containing protein [Allohahella sp. A8]|uniref:DUF6436 domain-containing protein n=1 Tax=Allohahella sp. A8 TaxID=3141461 RepID=UPI003A80A67E